MRGDIERSLWMKRSVLKSHLDCQRLPLFHTRPKEGNQLASVCELWSKLAPTLFGGSFFSFSCSSEKKKIYIYRFHVRL